MNPTAWTEDFEPRAVAHMIPRMTSRVGMHGCVVSMFLETVSSFISTLTFIRRRQMDEEEVFLDTEYLIPIASTGSSSSCLSNKAKHWSIGNVYISYICMTYRTQVPVCTVSTCHIDVRWFASGICDLSSRCQRTFCTFIIRCRSSHVHCVTTFFFLVNG